jgi:cell wall-associated NlpC family hydrolase
MIKARRIIIEAKKFLNAPFSHCGRSAIGLDCSGLLWIAHYRCGLKLKKIDKYYSINWYKDPSQGERIINGFMNEWGFEISDIPIVGGLILFRIFGENSPVSHCGLLINENEFIHAKYGYCTKFNRVSIDSIQPKYIKRIACYMKHREVDYGFNIR